MIFDKGSGRSGKLSLAERPALDGSTPYLARGFGSVKVAGCEGRSTGLDRHQLPLLESSRQAIVLPAPQGYVLADLAGSVYLRGKTLQGSDAACHT